MSKDAQVDNYIQSLTDWQQDICHFVRELIHEAEPEIVETIKFSNRPYFTLQGNVCALLATKITSMSLYTIRSPKTRPTLSTKAMTMPQPEQSRSSPARPSTAMLSLLSSVQLPTTTAQVVGANSQNHNSSYEQTNRAYGDTISRYFATWDYRNTMRILRGIQSWT